MFESSTALATCPADPGLCRPVKEDHTYMVCLVVITGFKESLVVCKQAHMNFDILNLEITFHAIHLQPGSQGMLSRSGHFPLWWIKAVGIWVEAGEDIYHQNFLRPTCSHVDSGLLQPTMDGVLYTQVVYTTITSETWLWRSSWLWMHFQPATSTGRYVPRCKLLQMENDYVLVATSSSAHGTSHPSLCHWFRRPSS